MDVSGAPQKTDRKTYLRDYRREWMRRRRQSHLAGKVCLKCGSAESLEIHHREPELKVHHSIWSWRQERLLAELAKCDILCYSCHLFITRATAIPHKPAASGFRGVRKSLKPNLKKPWMARMSVENRKVHIGYFRTAEEAAFAHDLRAIQVYGPLATTNFRLRPVAVQPMLNRQLPLFVA